MELLALFWEFLVHKGIDVASRSLNYAWLRIARSKCFSFYCKIMTTVDKFPVQFSLIVACVLSTYSRYYCMSNDSGWRTASTTCRSGCFSVAHFTGLPLVSAWINIYINYEVFPNFSGAPVEVLEWMHNFIPCLIMGLNIYPCWD